MSPNPSPNLILLLCILAKAVYEPLTESVLTENHCSLVLGLQGREAPFQSHFAVVRQGDALIVVFRGTNSLQDWLTNIYSGPALVQDGLYAHRGYWKAVSKGMNALLRTLDSELPPNGHIYFTGHSKGGGEAILAYLWWTTRAQHIRTNFPRLRAASVRVITFGAPLVVRRSDNSPHRALEALDGAVINYVTSADIVPKCLARRTSWKIRDTYWQSRGLLPTFASALGAAAWQAATRRPFWTTKFSAQEFVNSSHSVRETMVYAVAYALESLRTEAGPQFVPIGRFVELSAEGPRELALGHSELPERLSFEVVWEMMMAHYPARYVEALAK